MFLRSVTVDSSKVPSPEITMPTLHKVTQRYTHLLYTYPLMCRFYDKTLNLWEDRKSFVKHPGKYDLLLIDHNPKVIETDYEIPLAVQSETFIVIIKSLQDEDIPSMRALYVVMVM